MRYLPPLNSLKAFYAASRARNFSDAAESLNVTHGSVSRHIAKLEDQLGVRLFRRLPRAVELTKEGRALAFTVQEAFELISDATENYRIRSASRFVSLSTVPSLAARWLIPRLEKFEKLHPEIGIKVSTTSQLVNPLRDEIDFVIRYGRGDWSGFQTRQLFPKSLITVCSIDLLKRTGGSLSYKDIPGLRLLVSDGAKYWDQWFQHAGLQDVKPKALVHLDDANVVIEAVLRGQGVGLLPQILVRDELISGRLVQAFKKTLPAELGFYLAFAKGVVPGPEVRLVMEWIRGQAKKDQTRRPDRLG